MSLMEILIALLFAGLASATLGKTLAQHVNLLVKEQTLLARDSINTSLFVKTDISSCRREQLHQLHLFYCEQKEEQALRKMAFLSD